MKIATEVKVLLEDITPKNIERKRKHYLPSLDPSAEDALDRYSIDSTEINKALRKNKSHSLVPHLDRTFNYSLKRPLVGYRGVRPEHYPEKQDVKDPGYTSVSLRSGDAVGYGGVVHKFKIPAGTKVAIPSNEWGDYEVVLPRNSVFRRTGKKTVDMSQGKYEGEVMALANEVLEIVNEESKRTS